MAQVYCPTSIAEHPNNDPGHHYATPYAVTGSRTRCMSESASYNQAGYLRTNNTNHVSGNGEIPPRKLNCSDSGYFSANHHKPYGEQENSGGYVPQKGTKAHLYGRSQSVSGRPTQAQAYQLAALASHAARSRSAPMPPVRKSSVATGYSDENLSRLDGSDEENSDAESPSALQMQIQKQKHIMKAKARERMSSSMSEDR